MNDPNITRNETAAEWVVRLNSDQRTRTDQDAFQAWLDEDADNAQAYGDHAGLWAAVGRLADDEQARAILLPAATLARPARRPSRRLALFGGLGAAAATLAAVLATPVLTTQAYATAPGEQRRLTLADGSVVMLNTDSALRVRMRRSERWLFLDRGQAFFQVAKDARRPFRVFVGGDEVRALGTAFDIRRMGDGARVTLEEGRLALYRGGVAGAAARPEALLAPGQQATLARTRPPAVQPANLRRSLAWRTGRLVLEDDSLAEAAAELNRYGAPHIVLADPATANLRISGVFHTRERSAFVESVTAAFPVQVVRQDADEIVLARRS